MTIGARAAGSSDSSSARRLGALGRTVALYLALVSLMWAPHAFGFGGWLYLYPLFLLGWLGIEALTIHLLVQSVRALVRAGTENKTIEIVTLTFSALLVILSLPVLWFGAFIVW